MPQLIEWTGRHWLVIVLIIGAVAAVAYIFAKRQSLFYKE